MQVILFHGFASSPNSTKFKLLQDAGFDVIAPSINIDPDIADKELVEFVKSANITEKCVFIGTSLGGFWAARMAEMFDARCILINPAMSPEVTLNQFIGSYTDYATNEIKSLSADVVEKYKNYSSNGSDRYRTYFTSMYDSIAKPYIKTSNEGIQMFYNNDDHQGLSFFGDVISYVKSL